MVVNFRVLERLELLEDDSLFDSHVGVVVPPVIWVVLQTQLADAYLGQTQHACLLDIRGFDSVRI